MYTCVIKRSLQRSSEVFAFTMVSLRILFWGMMLHHWGKLNIQ